MSATLQTEVTMKDRRPIGVLCISNWPLVSADNPAGFIDGLDWLDKYLARALPVLKEIDAQGVIVWDLEGAAFKDEMYLGAPDLAETLNPGVPYDSFFKRLRGAGLKVGVCLRPCEFNLTTKKQEDSPDPYRTLLRKATYARKRWGCKLFYVDTNCWHVRDWPVLPAAMFEGLRRALPGCLFIPEHARVSGSDLGDTKTLWDALSYWESTVVYSVLKGSEIGTPARVREFMPDAFSVINCSDGDIAANADALRAAFARGDVAMINAWWDDKERIKAFKNLREDIAVGELVKVGN